MNLKEKPIWQMQGSELVELIQSSISGISTTIWYFWYPKTSKL